MGENSSTSQSFCQNLTLIDSDVEHDALDRPSSSCEMRYYLVPDFGHVHNSSFLVSTSQTLRFSIWSLEGAFAVNWSGDRHRILMRNVSKKMFHIVFVKGVFSPQLTVYFLVRVSHVSISELGTPLDSESQLGSETFFVMDRGAIL